jgi:hypothetical protein
MSHRSLPALSLGLLGCLLPAQRVYVNPPTNATVEASTRLSFPFAGNAALRLQFICALKGQVGLINKIAWRRDNDTALTQVNYVAFQPDFDLTLSSSPRTPVTISKVYANNHGVDAKMVHSGLLNWPAENFSPPGPTPFNFTVPLPSAFLFTGQTDICIDIARRPYTNPNTAFFFDADSQSMGTLSTKLGDGCPNATSNLVVVYDNWAPGANARILQYSAASASPSALVIGDNNIIWGGLLLPYDLGPIGAPGCRVYSNHVLAIPGLNSTSTAYGGRWDFSMELPNDPLLAGLKVFMQFYNLVDVNAGNQLNISVSQGYQVILATPTPGKPAVSEAHGSPLTATEAQLVQQGYGYVTEFTF